jgi:hypothetical protein
MKQYTNESQTAKLIELGFEKPKGEVRSERGPFSSDARKAYYIGELFSFLPRVISNKKFDYATINIFHDTINWVVGYVDRDDIMRFITSDIELIDALCTMCRKLKAEGVI